MTKEEWNELATALEQSWQQSGAAVPAADTAPATGDTVEQIVRRVSDAVTDSRTRAAANERPGHAGPSSGSSSPGGGDGDAASEVLKTIGTVTGIGPIGTALVRLFGGDSDDQPELPEPVKYTLPPALAVTAGLTQARSLTDVSYAQGDRVRPDDAGVAAGSRDAGAGSTAAAPTIQIQVNAMDSRSFLDHSDEIAQAVRSAMLRSHALNDVVSEV